MPTLRKSLQPILIAAAFVVLVGATIYAGIRITDLQGRKTGADRTCAPHGHIDHQVIIQHDKVSPAHTDAMRCDKFTIINLDESTRLLAFGKHDQHTAYDGVSERLVASGQDMTVVLITPGQFRFHDHFNDGVYGTFSVTP